VKLSAIGASLAFLLLSYRLLAAERALKDHDGNPLPARPEILRDIRRFRRSALIFLIVGVLSEFFLTHGVEVIAAANQLLFRDELVRVRFNNWEYAPENQLIGFAFEENHVSTKNYVLPALKDQYDVYVGVRQKTAVPFNRGDFNLMFGPYVLGNQPRLNQTLAGNELALLGHDCIEFTAFGVPKVDGKTVDIALPFDPTKFSPQVSVFNSAGVCANR
jgi:hypothetical protein